MHQKNDQQFEKLLNRICIGKQTNDDLRILQSRKVTQEQFETLHHIPHFFPTRRKVVSYNESVDVGFSFCLFNCIKLYPQ